MIHKTRKIDIAYHSSKWWQWCKTDGGRLFQRFITHSV